MARDNIQGLLTGQPQGQSPGGTIGPAEVGAPTDAAARVDSGADSSGTYCPYVAGLGTCSKEGERLDA